MDKIKNTIISKANCFIYINNWEIGYYLTTIVGDDTVYIDVDTVKDMVKSSINTVEIIDIEYIDVLENKSYERKAYTVYDFIEHLKPKLLKPIARFGLKSMLNDSTINEYEDKLPIKRELSEFDEAVLKAMKYNPKEKKS